jgi:hypothetical protein
MDNPWATQRALRIEQFVGSTEVESLVAVVG